MGKYGNPVLVAFLAATAAHAAHATDWVRSFDGSTTAGWTGTITFDDWGFAGPNGRTAVEFDSVGGFGNGTYNAGTADYCISNPAACGIGQMQHVVTTGPDRLTPDAPANIQGDFSSPYGPYANANVDSLTTFYHWGYTTVAGSTFDNMLIDFDGDYQVAKNDMNFQFYNIMDYQQVVADGDARVGTVADGIYNNKLAFQPYALTDARGWCGSILADHPNAHEAMAGQVTFDIAMDVYFRNDDGTYTYWSTEITTDFVMRSYGDITVDLVNATGLDTQQMSARAVVNNTDPTVFNQTVGPDTPVGDPDLWHNRVSFMGADVLEGGSGMGHCGILTPEFVAGARGPGIMKFSSLIEGVGSSAECAAAGGSWQTTAFTGFAYILRADAERMVDYTAPSYGPDPMAAVPVPAAALLFGSGLIALVGVARHRAT